MKRTALLAALAIVIVGVALVMLLRPTPYYPIVQLAAPEGVALTFLQDPVPSAAACAAANQRVTAAILAHCTECSVDETSCPGSAPPALGETGPGPQDRVLSKGLHILITAPPVASHALCQTLAAGIGANDATAQCVPAVE